MNEETNKVTLNKHTTNWQTNLQTSTKMHEWTNEQTKNYKITVSVINCEKQKRVANGTKKILGLGKFFIWS